MQRSAVVVMGVSGSGKSTVGAMLAVAMGGVFADGDDFHSAANVAKMASGVPLTDADRAPWLASIAAWIGLRTVAEPGVVACSALRRAYRIVLIAGRPAVALVYLDGDHNLIAARQAARPGHYMPTSLLASQFATLEPPVADEHPITVSIGEPPAIIVQHIMAQL